MTQVRDSPAAVHTTEDGRTIETARSVENQRSLRPFSIVAEAVQRHEVAGRIKPEYCTVSVRPTLLRGSGTPELSRMSAASGFAPSDPVKL